MSDSVEQTQQEQVVAQPAHSPADVAAAFFLKSKAEIKHLLTNMSAKQIRRFTMHAISYPMCDAGDMPKTGEEKRAAYLFNEMIQHKLIMQLATEMAKVEEADKVIQASNEGEENNG